MSSPPELVDLSSDHSFANGFPHETFTWLREHAPVFWHEPTERSPGGEGFWVVSRYADAIEVLKDPGTFSSDKGGHRSGGGTALHDDTRSGEALNTTDDPRHRRLRALVNKGFTPRAIDRLAPELEQRARDLLDAVEDEESWDFVASFGRELPAQAICSVLGVAQEDRAKLIAWVDEGIEADVPEILSPDSMRRIRGYGRTLIEEKRRNPADDIMSTIVHATLDDGSALSDRELLGFFGLLFPAGAETTRSALSGAVQAFIDHPEQLEKLRSEPTLMRSAIEEIVRWTTPSIYKRRTATRDTELGEQKIRAGDKVSLWEMSANRDERVFDDPFSFRIDRSPNEHIGFGWGVHFCLGANLARLELQIGLAELNRRFERLEPAGTPRFTPNNRLLGLGYLPVRAIGREDR